MIRWNAALVRRLACPETKKAALPDLVQALTSYSRKARTEGLQSLAQEAKPSPDSFLAVGLALVAEGLSDDTLEDILAAYLATSPSEGFDFLRECMEAEMLVSIAQGDPPALTQRKLVAYCGADRAAGMLDKLEALSLPYGTAE